jgi:mono/diheme cytochrome c family protein
MRTASLLVLVANVLVFGVSGCAEEDDDLPPIVRRDSGIPAGADAAIDAASAPSGLPCDVALVLSTYCASCHGGTPAGGATVALTTRERLLAISLTRPGMTHLEVAIAQMRGATMPPAPAAPVPDADIAVLEDWRAAGAPEGSCALPNDPFAGPDTCTSERRWTGGNRESPLMRPGGACIQCHTDMREGPRFSLAGTVYESGREVDDCNGLASSVDDPVVVEVTDSAGAVFTMSPNAAGNFFREGPVSMPITALVRYQGRERRMLTLVASGDCNGCHTLRGSMMAPGRILVP